MQTVFASLPQCIRPGPQHPQAEHPTKPVPGVLIPCIKRMTDVRTYIRTTIPPILQPAPPPPCRAEEGAGPREAENRYGN